MVCVHCGGKTDVVNSRLKVRDNQVWRRRQCQVCGAVFTTREAPEFSSVWQVRTNRRLEPFSRDKLMLSLYFSCQHRKTALNDANGLCQTVIAKLNHYIKDGTIDSKDITRLVQVALNRFDKVASTHYDAYHKL